MFAYSRAQRPRVRARIALLVIVLAGLAAGRALAVLPVIDWVERYSGLGFGNNQATDVVVDTAGNVYVTGYSSGNQWDFATVKYDPDGHQLHAVRFSSATGGDDVPWAMTVDPLGDVYVVGESAAGTFDNADFITIKYDSTLTQQWVRIYTGQFNLGADIAYSVAADSLGNVYVTGFSFEAATDDDIVTIKYDVTGAQQWVRRFDGPGNSGDSGNAVKVDRSGNVYVTGIAQHDPGFGNMDLTTLKYDTGGTLLWSRLINGANDTNDGGIALALDADRNVCIAGYITGQGTAFDFATVKYDADGNLQWTRTYDPEHANDSAHAIAVDKAGNVLVTGFATVTGTDSDYATIAYDPDGQQLWLRTYDGPVGGFDEGQSVAVDADGGVYVTGYSDGDTDLVNYDYATIKYDALGNEQWIDRYDGTGDNIDVAVKVALAPAGKVVVGGWSTGEHGTDVDFTTIEYDQQDLTAVPGVAATQDPLRVVATPNPFGDQAVLGFRLPAAMPVDLALYDVRGRRVRTLLHGPGVPGPQQVTLAARDIPAGVYLYRLQAGSHVATGKIVRR